jgi:hypothetical protein
MFPLGRCNLLSIHLSIRLETEYCVNRCVVDDVSTMANILPVIIIVVGRVLKGALLTNRRFGLEKTKTN